MLLLWSCVVFNQIILQDAILEDIKYFFQIEAGPSPYVAESVSNRSNW